MLGIAASSIVSFINKRDFRALSNIFPSYGAVSGAVYNKKNPNLSKSLIYGSILGFFYWLFIYDWLSIVFPEFWNSIAGWIVIILNPILQGYKGGLSQLSPGTEIMGVFWNPIILMIISTALIILFEGINTIKIIWYKGVPWIKKRMSTPLSLAIVSIYPFIISREGGDLIDIMFAYLISLLIGALSLIIISEIYGSIIKLINKGREYIKQISIIIISFILISIYPFFTAGFNSGLVNILFAYLYVFLGLSIGLVILGKLYEDMINILYKGFAAIYPKLIIAGPLLVILILSYFLSDGNVEAGYIQYEITSSTSKLVSMGMNLTLILLLISITALLIGSIKSILIRLKQD